MSSFNLTVTFGGQVGLAPKKGGGEAKILMPMQSNANGKDADLLNHYARLKFSTQHLFPEGTTNVPPSNVIIPLEKVNIKLLPPAGPLPPPLVVVGLDKLELGTNPSLVRRPPQQEIKANEFGVYWLAALEKACRGRGLVSGGGALDSSFLQPSPLDDDAASLLATRIELAHGRLYVSKLLLDPKDEDSFVVWRFRDFSGTAQGGDHLQVLASELTLVDKIEDDSLSIELGPLTKGDVQILKLYPQGGKINLVLQNEEAEQFIGEPTARDISFRKPRPSDKIFAGLFGLSFTPPPPDQRPIPVADYVLPRTGAELESDGEPAQSAPPCSPGRFDPYG